MGDLAPFTVTVLSVDEERNIADFIVKCQPNDMIFLHRHSALTNSFVIDGRHIIHESGNRQRQEVRPVGCYTSSQPGDVHHEGGGAEGCMAHNRVQRETEAMCDVSGTVLGALRTAQSRP